MYTHTGNEALASASSSVPPRSLVDPAGIPQGSRVLSRTKMAVEPNKTCLELIVNTCFDFLGDFKQDPDGH